MPEKEADSVAGAIKDEGRAEMGQPWLKSCRGSKELGLLQMLSYHHVAD